MSAPDRIVITATGILSALGTGREAHMARIRRGAAGLRHPRILQTRHAAEFVLGEVPEDNAGLMGGLSLKADAHGYTRTALLSICAIRDLISQVDLRLLQLGRLAFINANTVGGMSEVENLYMSFIDERNGSGASEWIDTLDCAESTEHIARFYGLTPQMATISTACSSSANSMIIGARMLRHGLADFAIAGGGDALSRFTLNGFHSLKNVDREPCKPFDGSRNGLNLGEGAGYVLLERERDALARNAPVLAVLSGWSNANDAYHPTAPSPDGSGALRTMRGALEKAGLSPADISYVNAHGTATLNNDIAEGKAIELLWNGAALPYSSTKPFTGHTLAAAGAIEAIISIGAMEHGIVPPNLNWSMPMDEVGIVPSTAAREGVTMDHVMSNSFGFGGNNVSLIFSRP
jgi:3-oxoacyl-[acyl-carrier-protein] synthase-1